MTMVLRERPWVPAEQERYITSIASDAARLDPDSVLARIDELIEQNALIHTRQCVQLNPAANVMNPRAEAALAAGLGSRPSLGYPGDKYEMGLEAVEQIEVIAAELAAEVFRADFAEVRIASGAIANLYAFIAGASPGDAIIVPPASIGGHVTHNTAGAAGLYGLDIREAPIDPDRYTVDVEALGTMARAVRPAMITIGASLNLHHHPVAEIRAIADEVGALVLFDAAHLSGLIAGGAWPDPLAQGAHMMTMSTYKSLGGPPSGLLVTNDAALAERIDAIAFPGLTANFDVGTTAALAISLLDWKRHGPAYAAEMRAAASTLVEGLLALDVDVVGGASATESHAFAVDTGARGGHATARDLRAANLLTSAIGLPGDGGSAMTGLRIGTNEIVRWGMTTEHMAELAGLLARALHGEGSELIAADVSAFRSRFDTLRFVG